MGNFSIFSHLSSPAGLWGFFSDSLCMNGRVGGGWPEGRLLLDYPEQKLYIFGKLFLYYMENNEEINMETILEKYKVYKLVESKRTRNIDDDDKVYYQCLDWLEQWKLYDNNTGTLKEWYDYLKEEEMELEWVSRITEDMMETIGDGTNDGDVSNIFLENDCGSNDSEWVIVGQLYESLGMVYHSLRRFCEGHW